MSGRSFWSVLRRPRDGAPEPVADENADPVAAAAAHVAASRRLDQACLENRADLAWALANQTRPLLDARHTDDAIDAYIEIVNLGAGLISEPGFHGFSDDDLVFFVGELVDTLGDEDRWDRAPSAYEAINVAVATYRRGADAGREGYRWWLAGTLTGLAVVLSHLGSGEEALTTAEEAVRLVRAEAADILVAAGDAWTGEYAERDVDLAYSDCRMTLTESIMQWADQLEDLNRRDEAVSVVADAIEELRPPPGDLSGYLFATVLFAQARRLERAGRDADAVLARAEGIDVLRELTDVDEPGSRLVDELVAQAGVLTRLGRNDEAEQARNEAIRRNVASEAEGALDE